MSGARSLTRCVLHGRSSDFQESLIQRHSKTKLFRRMLWMCPTLSRPANPMPWRKTLTRRPLLRNSSYHPSLDSGSRPPLRAMMATLYVPTRCESRPPATPRTTTRNEKILSLSEVSQFARVL